MAFSDFKTMPEVQERFSITHLRKDFVKVEATSLSEQFLQDFEFKQQHFDVLASGAARCEAIIFPVLLEVYKAYADNYARWAEIHQSI